MPIAKKVVYDPAVNDLVEDKSTSEATGSIVVEQPVVKKSTTVIFESVDGKKMYASINKWSAEGRRIEVPREQAEEVERILKSAKYLFTKIA